MTPLLSRDLCVTPIAAYIDPPVPRERAIITRRYGLEAGEDERSLQEVAHEMGICKERVRQLQMRALEKLRVLAQRRHLEEPALL